MDMEHPIWCQPRRRRAAVGGTHKSDPVEAAHATSRISAWLQQHPDGHPVLALATAAHGIGAPYAFLSLSHARALVDRTRQLLEQAPAAGETT
ncbi:hypothetical protein ACNTMW_33715 [Planosporangium sp. 12N6]|uniref:hypothetical protein n=1 Tax=Planosporangium spinosum TaxID=3402278 RepID=UPI003CEBAE72